MDVSDLNVCRKVKFWSKTSFPQFDILLPFQEVLLMSENFFHN